MKNNHSNPEPVPAASQLAVLPFLAAIEGFLRSTSKEALRVAIHRVINREGQQFLQQVTDYVGPPNPSGMGRIFPVTTGIMGAAFENACVMRTKKFAHKSALLDALKTDMRAQGDTRSVDAGPLAWLAVPFVGPDNEPVLVLYADSQELNLFSENGRTETVVDMCRGYCRLIDSLDQERPFFNLRNFGFEPGEPVRDAPTVYSVQERAARIEIPRFRKLRSFNFEAVAA